MQTKMISFEEAYEIALAAARPLPEERVALAASFKRILAEDVVADMAMPPFDKAMVDGYACRRDDLQQALKCVETIAAGYEPQRAVAAGECAKIMTGAVIPDGVDCVFMVEQSRERDDGTILFAGDRTNDNIALEAQDIKEGETLLDRGHRILAPDIAVLASMGYATPLVSKYPRVAVIATGDELVEPSEKPAAGQIRNSNGYQLCAQLESMGIAASSNEVARDTEASLRETIGSALESNDVVLLSGGVSMGEFDLVPGVLKEHGIEIRFDKVAIQPGKPTVFGQSGDASCFGLPGNPVSTYTIFELLVKPFLYKMMGHAYRPPTVRMPLEETITRKAGARKAWVPAVTTETGTIRRVEYHGSAHLNAVCYADGLIAFPEGTTEIAKGDVVTIRLVRD